MHSRDLTGRQGLDFHTESLQNTKRACIPWTCVLQRLVRPDRGRPGAPSEMLRERHEHAGSDGASRPSGDIFLGLCFWASKVTKKKKIN